MVIRCLNQQARGSIQHNHSSCDIFGCTLGELAFYVIVRHCGNLIGIAVE